MNSPAAETPTKSGAVRRQSCHAGTRARARLEDRGAGDRRVLLLSAGSSLAVAFSWAGEASTMPRT